MKALAFGDLFRLPIVRDYEAAFRKATGVSLLVVPPDGATPRFFGEEQNPFCGFVSGTRLGCEACLETEQEGLRRAAARQAPYQFHCFAGLTVVAVPVMVEGKHLATLLSGQVLRREPTQRDFALVVKMLGGDLSAEAEKRARRAYFDTPIITADRFRAIIELLSLFAQQLAGSASRLIMASSDDEPRPVAIAKEFVQAHLDEELTLSQVAQQAHVSPFYFCKVFRKTTGMTLTEYIGRVRVEKAKDLLGDPSLRISEVVYAAGFGSIPRFNSVFKRHVGMPPSEYRATLRGEPAG